jgi:hypothetical protein
MRLPRPGAVRVLCFISAIAWVWSWYTMYLEIHRWKHVTRSLRFNTGPPIAGTTIRPSPGLPLKALYACSVGAPTVLVGTIIAATARARNYSTSRQETQQRRPQEPVPPLPRCPQDCPL